jgi:putative ABC transport system substrate-binding protein
MVLALLLLSAPLAPEARAQVHAKVARLGFLGLGDPAPAAVRIEALRAGLRDLGYAEGKNLVIEFRWTRTVEQMREAAAELARIKVDVIFASSSTEVEAARRATRFLSFSQCMPIPLVSDMCPVSRDQVAT